jgi:hypothetical protein
MNRFLRKIGAISLLLVVALTLTLGGVFSAETMMGGDGMMHHCPYMGVASMCNMSPLEHLSLWQQMFASIAQEFSNLVVLMLLAFSALCYLFRNLFTPQLTEVDKSRHRYKEKVFDPLQIAFARGILNTKAF